jgi:hypothetical protein
MTEHNPFDTQYPTPAERDFLLDCLSERKTWLTSQRAEIAPLLRMLSCRVDSIDRALDDAEATHTALSVGMASGDGQGA